MRVSSDFDSASRKHVVWERAKIEKPDPHEALMLAAVSGMPAWVLRRSLKAAFASL